MIAKIAARAMAGEKLVDLLKTYPAETTGDHIAVEKSFPFRQVPQLDIILGPEMKSTGEVMGIDPISGWRSPNPSSAAALRFHRKVPCSFPSATATRTRWSTSAAG